MEKLVREYIQNFIYKILATEGGGGWGGSGGGGGWGEFFAVIGSLFGGYSKGGIVPAYAKGGIVEPLSFTMSKPVSLFAASQGMVVPPSFGTDTVPAMLTPKEMVLDKNISNYIVDAVKQSKGESNGQVRDVHVHFNVSAIDAQGVSQFFYQNRDQIVGLVNNNIKIGGVLRNPR